MDFAERIPAIIPYALAISVVVTGLVTLAVSVYRRMMNRSAEEKPVTDEELHAMTVEQEREWPNCMCGARATNPSPRLVRKRTGWLRSIFAAAPSYKRVVPKTSFLLGLVDRPLPMEEYVFCEAHAHTADAMLDRFIYEQIRATQAETNEKIAIEAAAFEGEKLLERVRDSIETRRKRTDSIRPEAPVRLLTGTD
jgi:hypothetical protein